MNKLADGFKNIQKAIEKGSHVPQYFTEQSKITCLQFEQSRNSQYYSQGMLQIKEAEKAHKCLKKDHKFLIWKAYLYYEYYRCFKTKDKSYTHLNKARDIFHKIIQKVEKPPSKIFLKLSKLPPTSQKDSPISYLKTGISHYPHNFALIHNLIKKSKKSKNLTEAISLCKTTLKTQKTHTPIKNTAPPLSPLQFSILLKSYSSLLYKTSNFSKALNKATKAISHCLLNYTLPHTQTSPSNSQTSKSALSSSSSPSLDNKTHALQNKDEELRRIDRFEVLFQFRRLLRKLYKIRARIYRKLGRNVLSKNDTDHALLISQHLFYIPVRCRVREGRYSRQSYEGKGGKNANCSVRLVFKIVEPDHVMNFDFILQNQCDAFYKAFKAQVPRSFKQRLRTLHRIASESGFSFHDFCVFVFKNHRSGFAIH